MSNTRNEDVAIERWLYETRDPSGKTPEECRAWLNVQRDHMTDLLNRQGGRCGLCDLVVEGSDLDYTMSVGRPRYGRGGRRRVSTTAHGRSTRLTPCPWPCAPSATRPSPVETLRRSDTGSASARTGPSWSSDRRSRERPHQPPP